MNDRYNPKSVESKWQAKWRDANLFATQNNPDKPKFYYLDMFPYPSGALHVGHVRNYAIGDAIARYRVMNGYNVLHPMGWDAFGLPAENAAIKNQVHPAEWTERCIVQMHEQFDKLGIAFDWSREVTTCRPDYYKWTQWLFIKFFNAGLAERRTANVNWCPKDLTVLANEQVKDGRCDRCGTLVEQKPLTQWFFKTTAYAQRLLDDLDTLTDWPDRVVKMQREWIGRSEGVNFRFKVKGSGEDIEVFTTRVDTVFGVTYMVIAPDHELATKLTDGTEWELPAREFRDHVARQKDEQRDRSTDIPKEGIFTGAYCINPMNGAEVPIWLGNYVLSDYGSGAVMAVPAHDERDFEFAQKYQLPINVVVSPGTAAEAYTDKYEGALVNSGEFDGLNPVDGRLKIAEYMEANGIGERAVNFKLRDWCLSRQRYWGCPIPIVYREDGSIETVPEDQLPVMHPTDIEFTGKGGNPLAQSESFINTVDSEGRPARRETDTMDTFVDSSWYFLRFCSPDYADGPFRREDVDRWMPLDQYVGGVEHATMHLIYARFFTKVLFDLGLVGIEEPFPRLFTQGMVTMLAKGVGENGEDKVMKMSKSKGNVVALDDAVERFGADATRMMTLFMGPAAQDAEWTAQSEDTFAGQFRFLERVWRTATSVKFNPNWREQIGAGATDADRALRRRTHQTIEKVGTDIERFQMNTAISSLMQHLNTIQDWQNKPNSDPNVGSEAIESLLLILSPFAPHLCDELGEYLGFTKSFYEMTWPSFSAEIAKEEEITIPVQVNGKLRARLSVAAEMTPEALETLALASEEVSPHLEGKKPKKVIIVPGRMVNIVV
ncbi:leucine--tRNA ligase [bacterium]|nr:MAG: leucine--tRNA ligase [bacterium]